MRNSEQELWRVSIDTNSGEVTMLNFSGGDTCFDSIDDLPRWVKERLAVLSVLKRSGEVEGLGLKINSTVYWVEAPTGIANGLGFNLTERGDK